MIIPNKHSGYQAGIRVYPLGGGGGGGGESTPAPVAPPPPPPPAWANLGVNTERGYNTLMQTQAPGTTGQQKGGLYNNMLSQGFNDDQIRSSADTLFGKQSNSDWSQLAQYAGQQSPTGRPLPGSAQFYQPVYQSQYQNLNTGNRMGVSQYGQNMGGFGGGFTPQTQQPTMFGGQMQGGGYGQFGMNNPFSPFSNSFLNMDPNLNRGTVADKANMYRNAIQSGFGDQQIYNQATGLFGQQSPQAWGFLQGSAMGMTPGLGQGSEQDKIGFYQGARNQGFNDQTIRNAANQMIGNQSQGDWSYLQNRSGFGGGAGGFGNQFMPQMQTPFSQQSMQQSQRDYFAAKARGEPVASEPPGMDGRLMGMQTPFSYGPPQLPSYVSDTISGLSQYKSQPVQAYQSPFRSSGPSQAIVGRSSQMRGTPNVMRRAEGGIASLMDEA